MNKVDKYFKDCWVANTLTPEVQEYLGPTLHITAAKIASISECEVASRQPWVTEAAFKRSADGSPPVFGSDDLGRVRTATDDAAGAALTRSASSSSPLSGSSEPGRVKIASPEVAPLTAAEIDLILDNASTQKSEALSLVKPVGNMGFCDVQRLPRASFDTQEHEAFLRQYHLVEGGDPASAFHRSRALHDAL